MGEYERHHYTPVFYQAGWADTRGLVTVTIRDALGRAARLPPQKPRSVGSRRHLWSRVDRSGDDPQRIERDFFKPLDGAASGILRRLISGGTAGLSACDRVVWGRFLASLHIRQPQRVRRLRLDAPTMLLRELSQRIDGFADIKGGHPAKTPAEFGLAEDPESIINAGVDLLQMVLTEGKSHRTIADMHWEVRRVLQGGSALLTSDSPLTLTAPLDDAACLLAIPLSPRHVFFACHRVEPLRRLRQQRDLQVVRDTNWTTVVNAATAVIGDCPVPFIGNLWREHPPSPG